MKDGERKLVRTLHLDRGENALDVKPGLYSAELAVLARERLFEAIGDHVNVVLFCVF